MTSGHQVPNADGKPEWTPSNCDLYCRALRRSHRRYDMVEEEILENGPAEGADERCHRRLSQARVPLNPKSKARKTLDAAEQSSKYSRGSSPTRYLVCKSHVSCIESLPAHVQITHRHPHNDQRGPGNVFDSGICSNVVGMRV